MPLCARTPAISAGDIASTVGKASLPSILSVVLVSSCSFTAPTLCRPRMASTISCRIRVLVLALIRFVITYLHQLVVVDQRGNLLGVQFEEDKRKALEFLQFLAVDIAAFILGKPEEKHGSLPALTLR